jgi:hypothetical protein
MQLLDHLYENDFNYVEQWQYILGAVAPSIYCLSITTVLNHKREQLLKSYLL